MKNDSLIKKSLMYMIGNFSSKILSALLIPLYAFYISSADLGYFDYLQTLTSMLSPIVVLAIWESILKFALSEESEMEKQKVVNNGLFFSFCMLFFFLLLGILFKHVFFNNFNKYYLFLLMTFMFILGQVLQYVSRALQKNKVFVISGIISTIINFLFVIALVVFGKKGIDGLLVSYILGQLSISIYIIFSIKLHQLIKFKNIDYILMLNMIKYSAPLVLNLISVWSLSGFGRFLITNNLGVEANGLYSFAFKFSLLISMVGSVVNMAFIEETILTVKSSDFILNYEKQVINIATLFFNICVLALPIILVFYNFLESTDYYKTYIYIGPLILYAFYNILSTNIGTIFQAHGQTHILFLTTMFGAAINIIISVLLINVLGIWAIVLAQLIGSIVVSFTRYYLAYKKYRVNVYSFKLFVMTLIYLVIYFVSFKINLLGNLILATVFFVYIVYTYKNLVRQFYVKNIRRKK